MEETKKQNYERATAKVVRINDLKSSQYFKVNEEFSPDYVLVGDEKISRANIIAIVVEKQIEEKFSSLTIDDGSGSIVLRDFDNRNKFDNYNIGQIIRTIAKPRSFNDEIYLVGEIVKPVKNNKWVELRKLELEKISPMVTKIEQQSNEPQTTNNTEQNTTNNKDVAEKHEEVIIDDAPETDNTIDKVLAIIKEHDKGEGADIEDVIVKANIKDCEQVITNLIREGEIFEVRPGRVKVL